MRNTCGTGCYPVSDLSVCILSIVNGKDVENLVLLVHDIEDPELADSVPPGLRGVPLKLFDVVSPEWFCFELGIDK
jgi:hypothetical protein